MVRQKILAEHEFDPGKGYVRDAMEGMCLENRFNPVVDWLNGLAWDGVPRLDRWLVRYLGAQDTPLNRAIGRKFLCGAVRRAKQPGCKFDHALILEGKQKIGKSTVVEILASGPGDGYYTDASILAEGKKEQQELVKGIWFYELSELTGIRKADAQSVLRFISRKKERGRMAYAHYVTTDFRSVVFIGTTNDQEYLRARDGNRRFWSVACNPVVGGKLDTDKSPFRPRAVVRRGSSR
jgi:predicted P-loop ATPase